MDENLHLAVGLAITPDQSALLYAESGAHRLTRLRVTGPEQGRRETVFGNLPGFCANLSSFTAGRAWLVIGNPRSPALDRLATSPAWLRRLLWHAPERLYPAPSAAVWAVAIDPSGCIVDQIHGRHKHFHCATGAAESGEFLYLVGPHTSLLELDLTGPRKPGTLGCYLPAR